MKIFPVVACFILNSLCVVYSAPLEADKTQPAASAKQTLRFASYDGDPRDPKNVKFQINDLEVPQRPQFLKLEDIVEGTKLKITRFDFKIRQGPMNREEDVSELKLTHTETKETIVLVLGGH